MDIVNNILNSNKAKQVTKEEILIKLNTNSQKILKQARQNIDFAKPIIVRDENGIFYPNTINIIQGKSGVHKSRLVEIFLASIISGFPREEHLGFLVSQSYKPLCLLADTERNLNEQLPYAIQQIKRLTGTPKEKDLKDFYPVSLIDVERHKRFESLKILIDNLQEQKEQPLFIVLDVVTDCIENFNDPKASLQLIDLMNVYINEYNITFLCVIHENPNSSDKARGHLGTELMNKASTVLQIGFENSESELIKVKYLKCRRSKRFEPLYLVYSDEVKRLVAANDDLIKKAKEQKAKKANLKAVKNLIKDYLLENGETAKSILIEEIKTTHSCSVRTVKDRLKVIEEDKELFTDENGTVYYLDIFKRGKTVFYNLKNK